MNEQKNDEVIVIHPPVSEAAQSWTPADDQRTTVVLDDEFVVPQSEPVAAPVHMAGDKAAGDRALGLDVFRGLLMFTMVLSFAILGKAGLPAWMYHMQFPPPSEQFTPIAGLTWRDLIFPGFIFAMAASIPLAHVKYLAANEPYPALIWRALRRAAILFAFALVIGQTNPFWTKDYTKLGNVTALLGFLACWPLLLARRKDWDAQKYRRFRNAGLVAAAALVLLVPLLYDQSFSLHRKDNVIHALAFIGLVSVPIWLFTRNNISARIVIILGVAALKLAATAPGWVSDAWRQTSWIVEPWFIELLVLAIPGTIAGEKILDWMRCAKNQEPASWPIPRLIGLAITCALVTPVLLIGLYLREIPQTTIAVVALVATGSALTHGPITARDRILADLFRWGSVFLILGMLL
ncbi:MAG TPA: DUF5009 domain-containing protein, partial [Longimicrobiales bacterium]